MKWLKDLKVGSKLIIGFSTMIVIVGVVGWMGYRSVSHLNGNLDEIFSVQLPSIDLLIEADRDLQQLLVAERSMLFANVGSDLFNGLMADYEENMTQAEERWNGYKALASTSEEKALIAEYEKARDAWAALSKQVVEGRLQDTREGRRLALDLTLGEARDSFETMRNHLDRLTNINLANAEKSHDRAGVTYRETLFLLLGLSGLGLLAGIVLMWMINNGVTRPLKSVISRLTVATDEVASASGQVSSASQSLAEGSSEQAASIEETSSSLEEMSSMTKQNADNAQQAQSMMQEAGRIVEKANANLREMIASISDISEKSNETGKIIKTIDEIAFQTNLLALNAAVEAARAGEAGAGFAVVADEVRNLALRAAEAAKNTSALIEGTIAAVQTGNELTRKTQEAFAANTDIAMKIGGIIDDIAAASREQAEGIDQVNVAVADMDKVTQQNAANAEESASASEEMNAQARQMKGMIEELVRLVGGAANHPSHGRSGSNPGTPSAGKGHMTPHAGAGSRSITPSARNAGHEVDPEKAIPFDEDESFKDF